MMEPKAVSRETPDSRPSRSARNASPSFAGSTLLAARPATNAVATSLPAMGGLACDSSARHRKTRRLSSIQYRTVAAKTHG